MNAGMYSVSSTNRVSDLIESIMDFNINLKKDSLLYLKLSDYPKHIMFNKDIFLIREDSIINVNLFDYYKICIMCRHLYLKKFLIYVIVLNLIHLYKHQQMIQLIYPFPLFRDIGIYKLTFFLNYLYRYSLIIYNNIKW